MEEFFRLFKQRLYHAFFDWLDANRKTIGEKWYNDLWNKGRKQEAEDNSFIKLIGTSMWVFNMIADLGVWAGVGPNNFDLQQLREGLDRQSSTRLLALISSSLGLQGLPREIIYKEIPIISSKKFSLQLFSREQHG